MHSSFALRQSTAELLAAAIVDLFPGALLVNGVATEFGFYYDVIAEQPIDDQALPLLEEKMRARIKQDCEVRTIEMVRENAAQYLEHKGQPIKAEEARTAENDVIALIQIGDFCDFCLLPHLHRTGEIGAFKLLQVENTVHYLPKKGMVSVKRIHGAASFNKEDLKKYLKAREAGRKCDHRQLGKEMKLFSHIQEISQPAWVWQPRGATIKEILLEWWRTEHEKRGFSLVSTPALIKKSLLDQAGIRSASPSCLIEGIPYAVPPTLIPSHAELFRMQLHSYRELPVRYAECAPVFPTREGGRLWGILQSDLVNGDFTHIFCDGEQLEAELISSLQFIGKISKIFGFESYWCCSKLSQKVISKKSRWEKVKDCLVHAFQKSGFAFVPQDSTELNAELRLVDRLGREWKGPTLAVELDLPERLGLRYQAIDGKVYAPFMIAGSVFGSIERFVAILLEHCAGKLPLWLAPEQVRVIPVRKGNNGYAQKLYQKIKEAGFRAGIDDRDEQLGKKIHSAQEERVPYMLAAGDKEESEQNITLRSGTEPQQQMTTVEAFLGKLKDEVRAGS